MNNDKELDYNSLKVGQWRNVTRNQKVRVINIYPEQVEYEWLDSGINKTVFFKSKEHFLRTYIKI